MGKRKKKKKKFVYPSICKPRKKGFTEEYWVEPEQETARITSGDKRRYFRWTRLVKKR